MSVLIKGMEMPKDCIHCFVPCDNPWECSEVGKRSENCPLIEVPTSHGRPIDSDKTEWINVKDKLPDKTNKIVILAEKLSLFGWIFNFVRWKETTGNFALTWNDSDYILDNSNNAYWAYLPNLPKEEEHERPDIN